MTTLADWCAYTIAHPNRLEQYRRSGEAATFTEGKRWVTARQLLARTRADGGRAVVLFADSTATKRLKWWGYLNEVEVLKRGGGTRIHVDRIRPISGQHRPQQLQVLKSGKPIPRGFIRPYVLCRTPRFVRDHAQDAPPRTAAGTIPDDPVVLDFLARSIGRAHQAGPASWVITQNREFIRLSVGQVAVLTVAGNVAEVYVRRPVTLGGVGRFINRTDASVYSRRAVPEPIQIIEIPVRQLSRLPSKVLAAHYAAIDAAASAKRRSPWKASLALGVLSDLEGRLGRPIPRPEYVLRTSSDPAYWVVKGDPRRNDFGRMLKRGRAGRWETRRPPRRWTPGDRLFFWASSPTRALIGLGELMSVPATRRPRRLTVFDLRYLTEHLGNPVAQDVVRGARVLKDASFLKSGPSGTLFPLSRDQAEALLRLITAANPDLRVDWPELVSRGTADLDLVVPDVDETALEGGRKRALHYRIERNRGLVARKKVQYRQRHGHLRCEICGFDFAEVYGELGRDLCEIHHLTLVSGREKPSPTRLSDLAVICSNCHRVVHRSVDPVSMARMLRIVQARRGLASLPSTRGVTRPRAAGGVRVG